MKVKVFNALNSKMSKTSTAYMRFHGKSGIITISELAAERFALKVGDFVAFVQDEENQKDWYLTKSDKETGFELRQMKESKNLSFNCSKVSQAIIASVNCKEVSLRCSVGAVITEDGTEYLPIITAGAKKVFEEM